MRARGRSKTCEPGEVKHVICPAHFLVTLMVMTILYIILRVKARSEKYSCRSCRYGCGCGCRCGVVRCGFLVVVCCLLLVLFLFLQVIVVVVASHQTPEEHEPTSWLPHLYTERGFHNHPCRLPPRAGKHSCHRAVTACQRILKLH